MVAAPGCPKLASFPITAAQVSTCPVAGPCAALFSRLQSTTLSPSLSVQSRLTVATIVAPRFVDVNGGSFEAKPRYLPHRSFNAVLPLPKTSYPIPTRGLMSLYASTPGVLGNVIVVGFRNEVLDTPLPSTGA